MDNSCPIKEDNTPPIFDRFSDIINNENFNYDSECPPNQMDRASISSNGSATSNLKIDAPEFIPFQKLKLVDLNEDKTVGSLNSDTKTVVISNDNKLDAEFQSDVLFLLQNIMKKLSTEFSKLKQNQGDLLFKSEDRINFLQKMFVDEISKEKQKLEEQKLKNAQLEAKLESFSEILAKTTEEKEEQIKQNVLLKSCLEKNLNAMSDFQKNILTEYKNRCSYMKTKLQQIAHHITYTVPWYEDFQMNLQAWSNHEILLAKHLARVECNSKLLKIVDYKKLDNLPTFCDFPVSEPKNILTDVFLHVIHSYNYLYQNSNARHNYQSNNVAQPCNNHMYYQPPAVIEGAPVYYAGPHLPGPNMQNSFAYRPIGHYQQNHFPPKNASVPPQTINADKKNDQDDKCKSEQKSLPDSNLENVSNLEESNKPVLNQACESNPNLSQQPLSKSCIDTVIPDQELPSPLSPNISQLKETHNQPSTSLKSRHKNSATLIKESVLSLDLIHKDNLETDRATQGTSETYFDDLDRLSPETENKKEKNEAKFYDASLGIEEQMENLSAEVKAAGGTKFLHLFLYLWQNIPYVTENALLQALLSVKKTVGKFTGMKKESILISVKRVLEPKEENLGIPASLTEICTICYEHFSNSKTLRLKCGHTFHSSCGKKWLVNNQVCPICRFCVLSEDDVQ